jgi:hypothetical protein
MGQVLGRSSKRTATITAAWPEQQNIEEVTVFRQASSVDLAGGSDVVRLRVTGQPAGQAMNRS